MMNEKWKPAIYVVGGVSVVAGLAILVKALKSLECEDVITNGKVYLIGDSLAVGLGPIITKLAQKTNTQFGYTAKGGTSIEQWRKKDWLGSLLSFQPKTVLISLGTNDAAGFVNVDELSQYIKELVARLPTNSKVIWISPPNISTDKMKNIVKVRKEIENSGLKYFPSEKLDLPLGDGIHPSGIGYQKWGESIWQTLTCVK